MFGMLWFAAVTLSLLQKSTVNSLSCFYCYSPNSWEDCGSKENKPSCGAQQDCLIFHRKITRPNGKEFQEFVKTCYPTSLCARGTRECYVSDHGKVTWCDMRCCKTNFCNNEMKERMIKLPCRNSTQKEGSSHSQGNAGSANRSLPLSAPPFGKKGTINSTKRKDVETIAPRAVLHQRKNMEKTLGSSLYVTVAMAATSLVVARQYWYS